MTYCMIKKQPNTFKYNDIFFSKFLLFEVLLARKPKTGFYAKNTTKVKILKKKFHFFTIQKYIFLFSQLQSASTILHFSSSLPTILPFSTGRRQPFCTFLPGRWSTPVDAHQCPFYSPFHHALISQKNDCSSYSSLS